MLEFWCLKCRMKHLLEKKVHDGNMNPINIAPRITNYYTQGMFDDIFQLNGISNPIPILWINSIMGLD